jgi:glutathionylspermidine amidase/synthetase
LGSNAGVEARSNCSARCIDPTPVHVVAAAQGKPERVYTGIQWQCVEYARRWWLRRRGIVFASVDTADAMWQEIRSARRVADNAVVPVEARENGGPEPPVGGDLVIYRADPRSPRLKYGHVAVVVGLDRAAGWVELAEQNYGNAVWGEPQRYARRVRLVTDGDGVQLVDDAVAPGEPPPVIYGWLHPSG